MDRLNPVGSVLSQGYAPKECYTDSLVNNLVRRKLRAQSELDAVSAALDALGKNPEVANILELISKIGR